MNGKSVGEGKLQGNVNEGNGLNKSHDGNNEGRVNDNRDGSSNKALQDE
jgi:hypothetical protein